MVVEVLIQKTLFLCTEENKIMFMVSRTISRTVYPPSVIYKRLTSSYISIGTHHSPTRELVFSGKIEMFKILRH